MSYRNRIETKQGRVWRSTIGERWVLVEPNPHNVWFARRTPRPGFGGGPRNLPGVRYTSYDWEVTLQADRDGLWTFRARTLDEAATRILDHPLAPRDPLPADLSALTGTPPHDHCAHSVEDHERMGWTCDLWPPERCPRCHPTTTPNR